MDRTEQAKGTTKAEIVFVDINRQPGRRNVFAKASWVAADILKLTEMSKKEANAFLARHEHHLRGHMIETGWVYLEEMLAHEGYEVNEDPEYT